MALGNIPMPELSGDSFLKGLSTGSDLIHNMMLNKYYNTLHPSGDVENAMYVEQLRTLYGENDPRYIQAKQAQDLALQQRQSMIGYRDVLNQTAGVRATSPLGKVILEGKGQGAQDILNRRNAAGGDGTNSYAYDANGNNIVATPTQIANAGTGGTANGTTNVPTVDNNPRTPEERAAYERDINKKTSDATARNILLRAENLDKTRSSINPDDLTRYSGLKGTGNWLRDTAQAALGNPSPEYTAHQTALTSASLMRDQMRQFYGDSIQPKALERLDELTNPSTWYKNPEVAKQQWNQLNKILDTETNTYRNHATSPITLNKIDFKDGQFLASKNPANQGAANTTSPSTSTSTSSGNTNAGGSYDMNVVVPQLMKINPNYTEKNIRSTAREMNMSVDDVIYRLFQKSSGRK